MMHGVSAISAARRPFDRAANSTLSLKWGCWETAVKARQLIKGAVYDPAALKVIYKAFDDAWDQIAPAVSGRADALEAAPSSSRTSFSAWPATARRCQGVC